MTHKSALIGYTGFVGSNILAKHEFGDLYNSSNIEDIAGKDYALVVCSGARAEKWRINQDPETDWKSIERLEEALAKVKTAKLVLISTVDVYQRPAEVDEDTPVNPNETHPYGKHRILLEEFCRQHFDTLTVRLPGLFGPGLKKNVIFDFLHDNQVDNIHADSEFQFYNLVNLWGDIERALSKGIQLLNIATEPVKVSEVAQTGFGFEFSNRPAGSQPVRYDFRSKHAEVMGGQKGYLYTKDQVLSDIRDFVNAERKK